MILLNPGNNVCKVPIAVAQYALRKALVQAGWQLLNPAFDLSLTDEQSYQVGAGDDAA